MSREIKISTVEDFIQYRTFQRFIPGGGYSSNIEVMDPFAEDFYKQKLALVPDAKPWGGYGRNAQTQVRKDYSAVNLQAINREFLKLHRPTLSASVVNQLTATRYSYRETDAKILSMFMLNEFLAQDEFPRYHDFLNAKWDELHPHAVRFRINQYAHTDAVYQHYSSDSPFTVRPKASKKLRMALEGLSKDELLALVTKTKPASVTTNSLDIFFTNQLKVLAGESERQLSLQEASNQLLRAFSVALLAGGYHSNLKLVNVYSAITEIVGEITSSRIARDAVNYTANQITPNDLGKIGTFLEKNGAEFSIGEMFFVIYSLQNHKLFARIGTTADVTALYLDFLKRDNALDLFKMVGELAQGYSQQLPTAVQWRKALDNGDLDFVISSEITVTLVAASDKPFSHTQEVNARRRLFGGNPH